MLNQQQREALLHIAREAVEAAAESMPYTLASDDIQVGTHGVIVQQGSRRGLLLPQVPVEWGWSREEFLDQPCVKAGLPPGAWRRGVELYASTAEVFGEKDWGLTPCTVKPHSNC